MQILVAYRAIPQSPGWATGDSLVRAFRRLGHEAHPYAKLYQQDEWLPTPGLEPDLVVYLEMNDGDPHYAEPLEMDCPKVYWEFDTSMHRDWSAGWCNSSKWCAVYLANPAEIHGALEHAEYLPYAVDDELYPAGPGWADRTGAACIGHPFPERVEFCHAAGVELRSGIYREDYVAALRGLVVSVHHHDSGGEGLLVGRIWETLGAGACLMAPRTETMDMHFKPGVHYMPYTDAEDCRERLGKLSERPAQVRAVAADGHQEVMRRHTYLARAQTILAAVLR
jgi:hypothetical protein